eukprot:Gb_11826 [translate_table: standard]
MENLSTRSSWWLYALPMLTKDQCSSLAKKSTDALVSSVWPIYAALSVASICVLVVVWWSNPGGVAWWGKTKRGDKPIPGPRGWPVVGSLIDMTVGLAHHNLAELAVRHAATKLMAFSLGSTPAVITSDPDVAREMLSSPYFADRPVKQSAKQLKFDRAIGFAPNGDYWRLLRRISSAHLFAPRRIIAHETGRQADALKMLHGIRNECRVNGVVKLRPHLQGAALNNIMGSVFGRRFDVTSDGIQVQELRNMVDEGFELLGSFNWADHLPWLRPLDPLGIHRRCARLVPRVKAFVKRIIDEHRDRNEDMKIASSDADFVDVLLSLQGEEKLEDDDMIAVLWVYGLRVPAGTTAMVNMWSITHDPNIWDSPSKFLPQRFVVSEGGQNVDVRGNDLRLAPFGAGRRVCPGKALGLATVHLWVAKLLHHFKWAAHPQHPVDLSEVLKLSCQMAKPLIVTTVPRNPFSI